MTIIRLVFGRTAMAAVTLLLVSVLIFLILEALPGDAASRILGRDATQKTLELLRLQLQLDDPAPQRYLQWVWNALHGDFGRSLVTGRPVSEVLAPRILNTLALSALAFILYLFVALIPALLQAVWRDSAFDHAMSVVTLLLMSLPDFLLSTLLLFMFAVVIPIFPPLSIVSDASSWADRLMAMFLPALTLAIIMAVYAIRILRDGLIEVLQSDFVRFAEMRGLKPHTVLLRHALPNALVPTLNVTALNVSFLVGGVVVVERVFAYPGFGTLMIDALQLRDVPVIKTAVIVSAAVYIFANLLADIGAVLLQPQLRGTR